MNLKPFLPILTPSVWVDQLYLQKRTQSCENFWKILKTCENLWRPVKTCENLWKPLKTDIWNIFHIFPIFSTLFTYLPYFQHFSRICHIFNTFDIFPIFETLLTYLPYFQHFWRISHILKSFHIFPIFSRPLHTVQASRFRRDGLHFRSFLPLSRFQNVCPAEVWKCANTNIFPKNQILYPKMLSIVPEKQ